MLATVEMYLPDKAFGFCESAEAGRFYFHAESFDRGLDFGAPMAIPGEPVEVEGVRKRPEGKTSKALLVRRLQTPNRCVGLVKSFDPRAGWGFVETHEGEVCFLHTSDITAPRILSAGMVVQFFKGSRKGRPRACYVTLPSPY